MASEPTVTREMAEAAWRHLWSQKRWAIEDVQEAITAALAVQARTHVVVPRDVIPATHAFVPREATPEMLAAWWRQKNTGTQVIPPQDATEIDTSDVAAYRAMLAASTENSHEP